MISGSYKQKFIDGCYKKVILKKKVKKLYPKHALYAKNAKETEKTKRFFVTFSSLVAFQLGGGKRALPSYAYESNWNKYWLVFITR